MAKRHKRLVVFSSDDEDSTQSEVTEQSIHGQLLQGKPTKDDLSTTRRAPLKRSRVNSSPKGPPSESDPLSKKHVPRPKASKSKSKSKPILDLLRSQSASNIKRAHPIAKHTIEEGQAANDVEDAIEDDSPVEFPSDSTLPGPTTTSALEPKIDKRLSFSSRLSAIQPRGKSLNKSKRFKALNKGAETQPVNNQFAYDSVNDRRPWTDRYGPSNLEELVVHKKKVSDIREWLESVMKGQRRKVCHWLFMGQHNA